MTSMDANRLEQLRLRELESYDILDTEPEDDYNDIVMLASEICDTPVSLITLLDSYRQWFKANKGLPVNETPIELAFCIYTIQQDDVMVVEDADQDERFRNNELVTGDTRIKFYAGTPLVTPSGFKLGTLCVIDNKPRSITERQKVALRVLSSQVMKQLELRTKVKKLKAFNDSNTKLLSILSHDLRRPLNHIYSLVQMTESNYLTPEKFQTFADHVKGSVQSTEHLLDNLIEWTTSQFEGKGLQFAKHSLYDLVEEEQQILNTQLVDKNIKFVNNISREMCVFSDLQMLRVIVRNIINNAIKFTENGTITAAAQVYDNEVELKISDTGKGMSEERLNSLFDWSKRKSAPGTKGEKGSALGLQVVYEFIQRLGGSIRVASELNKGTDVYLNILLG